MLNKIKKWSKYNYIRFIHNNFIISNLRGFKHLWKLADVVNGYVDYCKFKNATRLTHKHILTNIESIESRIKLIESSKSKTINDSLLHNLVVEENTLKKISKILSAYDNDGININIDDIVDDINDVFSGFNNIFNDECEKDNNINLSE